MEGQEHQEIKYLLRQNMELTKENNRLLRKVRRAMFWGTIGQFVWLAFFIGVPVFLYYYFLLPYWTEVQSVYEGFRSGASGFPMSFEEFFKSVQQSPTNSTQP